MNVVKLLLSKSANIEARTKNKWTPLHCSSQSGHMNVVEVLLSKDANIEAQTENKHTPLHESSLKGHMNIVELLLSKGANIEAQTKNLWTPLHCASRKGQVNVVEKLLIKGANIEAQDENNWTALHMSSLCGYVNVVEMLLSKGANIASQQKDGCTPLQIVGIISHLSFDKENFHLINNLLLKDVKYEEHTYVLQKIEYWKTQKCTFSKTNKNHSFQIWFECMECKLTKSSGLCVVCAVKCHQHHTLTGCHYSRFYCDCGAHGKCKCL